ncbi:hypothetical protein PPROV_000100100 [Pycnococcus provasolii]|uniref:Mitochondrial carrier protein n=1 Tax=Pycnococcus provasolii TaxID=41880 RepID=A0A830H5C8_9CHLO|nr:hypothetical protein PPROV_000100100 [Pycnococcus provasolii]
MSGESLCSGMSSGVCRGGAPSSSSRQGGVSRHLLSWRRRIMPGHGIHASESCGAQEDDGVALGSAASASGASGVGVLQSLGSSSQSTHHQRRRRTHVEMRFPTLLEHCKQKKGGNAVDASTTTRKKTHLLRRTTRRCHGSAQFASGPAALGTAGHATKTKCRRRRDHANAAAATATATTAVAAANAAVPRWTATTTTRGTAVVPVAHRPQPQPGTKANLLRSFISGGIAGMTAKTIEAPLDRVKIIFQTSQLQFSFPAAARKMQSLAQQEGVRALWKGNGVVMLRVAPYAALHFAAHEWFAAALKRPGTDGRRAAMVKKFLAGAGAGAFATCALYPLDVARAKMAVAAPGTCRNLWDTACTLTGSGRGIRGLYWGLGPTLLGILVYSGTTWTIYETLKEHPPRLPSLRGGQPDDHQHDARRHDARAPTTTSGTGSASTATSTSHSQHAFYGGFAGICGQVISYPLDVLRRRMQTTQLGNTMPLVVMSKMLKTEGVGSLFKGLSVNFVKGPVVTGVSFMTYNAIDRWLAKTYLP